MTELDHDLTVGQTYSVEMDDCCIEGSFTAAFLGWQASDDGSVPYDRARFDNGVTIGPDWSTQWKAR